MKKILTIGAVALAALLAATGTASAGGGDQSNGSGYGIGHFEGNVDNDSSGSFAFFARDTGDEADGIAGMVVKVDANDDTESGGVDGEIAGGIFVAKSFDGIEAGQCDNDGLVNLWGSGKWLQFGFNDQESAFDIVFEDDFDKAFGLDGVDDFIFGYDGSAIFTDSDGDEDGIDIFSEVTRGFINVHASDDWIECNIPL